ncbi:MAG: DUF4954 family protein [Paludibacteraceae bacterium]|nr:DUF4954 family protein [Paludibacteraceae bacterium]
MRNLQQNEINQLLNQGCEAESWEKIYVSERFDPSCVQHVFFSGEIVLGAFEREFVLAGGVRRKAGIYHASLHNVTVGDDCRIVDVSGYIANYSIGANTLIENVGTICVDGETSFGNGVKVSVLSETGGREVAIYDTLSSHIGYMLTLYRHRPEFIDRLNALIAEYVSGRTSTRGHIGDGCVIRSSQLITNVHIGAAARIEGASRLANGSINSCCEAPVHIGVGVICEDFIISSGTHVTDGTMLTRCFVGQACHFGHGYSASDSLFFCNCQGENGEACAIFAGPFTVTHHKSTLLIAGMYSFMNAGSGSNQSNHMYKLGPIHQGILERGSKTASDSYILWPARVGAFSLVMGRHVTNSDTTNLPFSYLIEKNNGTFLSPGINLRSVGTIRDARKWPKRDERTDTKLFDHINYNLLSPFTIQKMMKGLELLGNLRYSSGELSDVYSYHSTKITNSSLRRGIDLYQVAINKFLGNSLISRLEKKCPGDEPISTETLISALRPDTPVGSGEWVDMAGLIAPKSEILSLMRRVEEGRLSSLAEIEDELQVMADNYYDYEWTWAFQHLQEFYNINPSKMTPRQAADIIAVWKEAVVRLDQMVCDDAKKEFNLASRTGFGADGDKVQKDMDFENVRGDFESNSFVNEVLDHIRRKSELGDRFMSRLV